MSAVLQGIVTNPQLGKGIADHVYRNDLLTLFKGTSVDYKRVAQIADLSKTDLGKLGNVAKSSVRYDEKIPTQVANRLREIANIANLVAEFFGGDAQKVELWFRLENPMLGNISPRNLIRLGRYDRLLNFVLDSRTAEHATKNTEAT